ncbi:hypothetical protein OXPF_12920 [Oxobacter pfennigii]|uniref:Uncharacterized protein n=1 Tax=Oxobacter pfennigii TaxID=36849 RepID=A0A0P8WBR6_9CLOT|nr:hypothetical protein OXPF_12920 [Oxobacter pfennigii]
MDLYCGNCKFTNTSVDGLKCKLYNSLLNCNDFKILRLVKCKFENSKINKVIEK